MQMARKKKVPFSLLCPLTMLENELCLWWTQKQVKLALASCLHFHICLNANEDFGINLTALVQTEASISSNERVQVHIQLRAHTLQGWLEIHNLTDQYAGHSSPKQNRPKQVSTAYNWEYVKWGKYWIEIF